MRVDTGYAPIQFSKQYQGLAIASQMAGHAVALLGIVVVGVIFYGAFKKAREKGAEQK